MARRGPPPISDDDRRIWARVTGTVTPPRTRKPARVALDASDAEPAPPSAPPGKARKPAPAPRPRPAPAPASASSGSPPSRPASVRAPDVLEPRRQRRLSRERDPIEASLDLHGYGRFEAEDVLRAFLTSSQARGLRAVLVVTGQGRRGGGVIRASIVEWLHAPSLRGVISGFAPAHRRHGGEGAIYVTLRRGG